MRSDQQLPTVIENIVMPDLASAARPGIYFLFERGIVVYVGQAVDMRRRIADHIGEGSKVFDAVRCLPYATSDLTRIERHYIELMVPKYNRCALANSLRDLGLGDFGEAGQPAIVPPNLTTEQAAALLGVSLDRFQELRKRGDIPQPRRVPRSKRTRYRSADLLPLAHAFRQ